MFLLQSTINLESPGRTPFKLFELWQKNEILPKNDQNVKKHKICQDDVIYTIWAAQKISSWKISIFDF